MINIIIMIMLIMMIMIMTMITMIIMRMITITAVNSCGMSGEDWALFYRNPSHNATKIKSLNEWK